MTLAAAERLAGAAALHHRFDAFLVDQFGVLLDGSGPMPGAAEALSALAATGARVLLLSNSGRRAGPNVDRLLSHGFARASFETVLSSGEAAHGALAARIARGRLRPGARTLVLARAPGGAEIEGLELTRTEDPVAAELVLIAGSRGDALPLSAYAELLRDPAGRGVPCLCTNPDEVMLTPRGPSFGPARIAALYETLGGAVEMIGKPHPLIYRLAHERLGRPDPSRVLCIGDSPAHDLKGAATLGFRSALVRTGVHEGLDDAALDALCRAEGAHPDFVLPRFA